MTRKSHLTIELGTTPAQTVQALQCIKDAMTAAIMHAIDATGIPDANNPHYQVWQSIYLQAQHQHTLFAAGGEATPQ